MERGYDARLREPKSRGILGSEAIKETGAISETGLDAQ